LIAALIDPRIAFRCLRTSVTRPVQVTVEPDTVPIFTRLDFR
jgi:hypothetical protein